MKRYGFILCGLLLVVQVTAQESKCLSITPSPAENCIHPSLVPDRGATLCDTISIVNSSESLHNAELRQIVQDCCTINFRFAKSIIDSGYMNNRLALDKMERIFSRLVHAPDCIIDSIVLSVKSAPDGSYATNALLAKRRAEALQGYLYWKFPPLRDQKITIELLAEDWNGLRLMIAADPKVPGQREALDIIDFTTDSELKEKFLRELDGGTTFAYITNHFLRYLRSGTSCVVWYRFVVQDIPVVESEGSLLQQESQSISPDADALVDISNQACEVVESVPVSVKRPSQMGIKTNVALLAAGVSNLGVEFSFGNHYSLDLPFVYSPYVVKRDYRLQVLALQPEFRYWLKEPMRGHFFGVHGAVGWFNVAMDAKTRYQDTRPLWEIGVSYGYSLPIATHWNAEFTIGGGYANVGYDSFYNIANGAKFDSGVKHYWGITRVGINLVYKFNLK